MRRRLSFALFLVLVVSALLVGTAAAHTGQVLSVTCNEVQGSFVDFLPGDHPISFAVSVKGGPVQTIPAIETPPGFVDGTAHADITSLTTVLQGSSGTITAYAVWPNGSTPAVSVTLSCGTPPTTTTTTAPPTTTTTVPPTTTTVPPTTTTVPTTTTTTPPTTTTRPPVPVVVLASPPPVASPVPVAPATAG